ncbi:MAG: RidA family protein [Pseudomonadota bacterium]
MKKQIQTELAPLAIGPYSQAIQVGTTLYISGQIPLDPQTGKMVAGGIENETKRALENLKAIVTAAGGTMQNIVKTTILLADMNDFSVVNEIYGTYFQAPFPARATFQVARLPRDARIEIEAIGEI